MLKVRDTGGGMPDEVKAQLFDPYFTTKERGKGTGLGLAIVASIAKQGGGTVSVTSQPAAGSTFNFYLPAAQESASSSKSDQGQKTALGGTETILLVEDDDGVRTLAKSVLEIYGYTVLAAQNAEVAMRLCREHQGPIQLLATDLVMPGMGGRQLAEQIAASQAGIKVLYMSGYSIEPEIRPGVLQAGMAFLKKPFSPSVLALKVREVLDGTN